MRRLAVLLLVLLFCSQSAWAESQIRNVRVWKAPDNLRLVFDLSAPVSHNIFMLDNPKRLVLDVSNSSLHIPASKLKISQGPVKDIRTGKRGDGVRLVFDLSNEVSAKSFVLKPNDQYGNRLVLDLGFTDHSSSAASEIAQQQPVHKSHSKGKLRDIVIQIDAGHGGEDPGAMSGRYKEKVITLAIAKRLKRLFDAEPGYKAYLTRTSDYYISLRGRINIARKNNADMFVSIHADSGGKYRSAHGASVWVLSNHGASSEMGRWLARKENSADLIGGVGSVSLEGKDDTLASVLLDMSMTASTTNSMDIASRVLKNIGGFAHLHKKKVERAAFVVLKSPDIPSILVETGFITNPTEGRRLYSGSYQQKMANAVFQGVKSHFWAHPPGMTIIAAKKQGNTSLAARDTYRVESGDTLSVIAARAGVSVSALRRANNLSGDTIRVGQVLKIPAG